MPTATCFQKHQRQLSEYRKQRIVLQTFEMSFRKIARKQVEQRAKMKMNTSHHPPSQPLQPTGKDDCMNNNDSEQHPPQQLLFERIVRRGVKSLNMTPELCGLFRKINRTRKMLREPEWEHGYQLLLR